MVDKYGTGEDPYCYLGTRILKNKFKIKSTHTLNEAEREITTTALTNNIHFSLPPYDLTYLKKIHYILFNYIYEWAGEVRIIDISKNDTRFCTSARIEPEAEKIFRDLEHKNYFQGYSHWFIVQNISELYADINVLHPFRDGNGRAQRILFEHIVLNNDYIIDWSVASTEEWITANIHGVNCNFQPLENIFRKAIKVAVIK